MNIETSDLLSSLTRIPKYTVDSLKRKECLCLSHAVSSMGEEDVLTADIGIGTLTIGKTENGIKYKFVPCKFLEDSIYCAFDGIDPLEKELEDSLASRILSTYKTLF